MPDRSDDYQIPSWPPTRLDREFLNPIFKDLAVRLKAREDLEASFEALQAQGIQASLDYIQVNVAPQIANLQTSIQLAQDQIDQIVIDGISPNSAKLGGQLPSFYATAQQLQDGLSGKVSTSLKINGKALSADITLGKNDVGLGEVDNTKDADKPISTEQAAALAKRVRVDAPVTFTDVEKARARANIDAIQQGGGIGHSPGHQIKIGWAPEGYPKMQVDDVDLQRIWTSYNGQGDWSVGYQKLPNGLILQWKVFTGASDAFVAWPIAYPNFCLAAFSHVVTGPSTEGVIAFSRLDQPSKTGVNLRIREFSGGAWVGGVRSTNLFSIGY